MRPRSWFCESRSPECFFEAADALSIEVGRESYFNDAGTSWRREARVIGRFCKILGADSCQLIQHDPPDGSFIYGGVNYPVEVVEALDPERRRGSEFRDDAPEIKDQDEAYLARQVSEFPNWVRMAAEKKITKSDKLPIGTVVLICLHADVYRWASINNFSEYMHQKIFDEIPKPTGNILDFVVLFGTKIFVRAGMFSKDA